MKRLLPILITMAIVVSSMSVLARSWTVALDNSTIKKECFAKKDQKEKAWDFKSTFAVAELRSEIILVRSTGDDYYSEKEVFTYRSKQPDISAIDVGHRRNLTYNVEKESSYLNDPGYQTSKEGFTRSADESRGKEIQRE